MLVSIACLAALAAVPDVDSRSQLELRLRGEFALAAPRKPARFKAVGPGRMVAYVLAKARADDEAPAVDLDVVAGGASVFQEHLTTAKLPGLAAQGARTDFVPGGLKRVSFDLLPKSRTYELRVSGPAAIAAYRIIQAPPGVHVPEIPIKPEGRGKLLQFVGKEKWHWASVCDRVSVPLQQSGTLRVSVRTGLADTMDLPPPTFLRAVSEGKVRAAFPITTAPEAGLEFVGGGSKFSAGAVKTLSVGVPTPGDYELELAAWGCVNGAGLQFDFEPGTPVATSESSPVMSAATLGGPLASAQVPGGDGGIGPDAMAQCGLQLDDLARARAVEYLDTMVASGVIPPSELSLKQSNEMGDSFLVQNVWYALDGNLLFQKDSPEVDLNALAQRRVVPGPHTLEVKATLRGRGSGSFAYLNDYVIKLTKREAFVAESGKKYHLKVTLFDKGGFSTPFKERPGLKVEFVPET